MARLLMNQRLAQRQVETGANTDCWHTVGIPSRDSRLDGYCMSAIKAYRLVKQKWLAFAFDDEGARRHGGQIQPLIVINLSYTDDKLACRIEVVTSHAKTCTRCGR